MFNASFKALLLLSIFLFGIASCKEKAEINTFSKGYIQKATFDSVDVVDILENSTVIFNEYELQKVFDFNELHLAHKIRFEKLDYSVFEWENSSKRIRVFTTEDTINLMVIDNEGVDQTGVYIQRNTNYNRMINQLVNNESFKKRTLLSEKVPVFLE